MKNKTISFIALFIVCSYSLFGAIERRATIDIGSGGTKFAIAEVETDTQQITQMILETSFPVPYQASLDKSSDGTFDEATRAKGLKVFQEIKELTEAHQVQKIVAVATSAFRKANNATKFVTEIEKQTQIKVRIIPQRQEGEIAFFSALASGGFNAANVLVWDIGTGSMQMTVQNDQQELTVYMGESMGSVAFKSYIIDTVQDKNVEEASSPNPMNTTDVSSADRYVRSFGRKAYPLIKQKIKSHSQVLGIGRLFYNSIRPLAADEEGKITRKGLRAFIRASLDKTDQELNNPYADVDVSNCILALAVMKALHIQEIYPVETTSTKGIMIYPEYWDAS